jgi:hypothetical protein
VASSLDSARIKLKRANLHAGTAEREAGRFFKRDPKPTFDIEVEGQPISREVGTQFWCRLFVKSGMSDLPESFSARFGDAIYNYRCVLDHIAWQLVKHGSDPEPAKPTLVQFPIYTYTKDFMSNRASRLPGVGADPVDFIQARHNYDGGKATNERLLALADLSNDDKHRSLHVIVSAIAQVQHNVTLTDCKPIRIKNPPRAPELKDGAEIVRILCEIFGSDPKVEMTFAPAGYVILEDGRSVSEVLGGIRREVAEILNAPEITSAL